MCIQKPAEITVITYIPNHSACTVEYSIKYARYMMHSQYLLLSLFNQSSLEVQIMPKYFTNAIICDATPRLNLKVAHLALTKKKFFHLF